MDIFIQGQSQTKGDREMTLEILNSFGCLKASSIQNKSTFVKFLRSKISFSERSNITVSRLRKNISNNSRDALLVVLVLILTATYQSAVNPPFELAQASLRQNTNYQRLSYNPLSGILSPPPPPNNPLAGFPSGNNNNNPSQPDDFFDIKIDPVALSFSIFNAIDFMVTLLVTLFILPWVPYGGLLHVLLLFVFIFFLVSMGLSFVLTTSNIGVILFCVFLAIAIILGIFIVRNKVRHRKVYRECIKELGDRVRLKNHHDDVK
ncbi:hypothetical protein COLO4_14918 [Corchorus olitorius]|uniref:PGG domain-containing protein n=1 Tax=Corchorus olitorius TaxID=93759 RepID=A0A1R3JQC5_9ROSI|nr:hypothetical protein COLO4_14918 [Corchorus olitorius]